MKKRMRYEEEREKRGDEEDAIGRGERGEG